MNHDSVSIVYPYVFPQDTKLPIDYDLKPHSTIVFLGKVSDFEFSQETVLDSLRGLELKDTGIVDVSGLALFGPENDVLVMTLKSQNLLDNHQVVCDRLAEQGIKSASDFDYSPHVTLTNGYHGPTVGYDLPTTIGLGFPVLWWEDQVVDLDSNV